MWILEYRNSLILLRLIMNLIVAFLTSKKVNHDALLIHGMLNIAIYGHISRGLNGVGSQNKFHPLFLGSQTHSSNLHHLFKIALMTKLVPKTWNQCFCLWYHLSPSYQHGCLRYNILSWDTWAVQKLCKHSKLYEDAIFLVKPTIRDTPSISKQKLRFTKYVGLRSFSAFLAWNCMRCIALTMPFPVS